MLRARCWLMVCVLVVSCGDDPSAPSSANPLLEYTSAGGLAPTFRKMTIDERGLVRKLDQADETLETLRLASSELDQLHDLLQSFSLFDTEYGQVFPDGMSTSITAWPDGVGATVTIYGLPYEAMPLELNQLLFMLGGVYARFDGGA